MITEPRAWNRLVIVPCGIVLFILTLNPTVPCRSRLQIAIGIPCGIVLHIHT